MAYKGNLPGRKELRAELAEAGGQIFRDALGALAGNVDLPSLYEGKPLRCLHLNFGRSFAERRTPSQLDEIKTELMIVSVIDPEVIDASEEADALEEGFIHPRLPNYVKKYIRSEVKRVGDLVLRSGSIESPPNCALETEYIVQYFNGTTKTVNTHEYTPNSILLTSGHSFAGEVHSYMQTEFYTRHPSQYHALYDENSDGHITHTITIPYSTRPPINGHEQQSWLEGYAKYLRKSIDQRTYGPKEPQSAAEFRGIADTAMDDGILLLNALDALQRKE
jgi:hypothetical protein